MKSALPDRGVPSPGRGCSSARRWPRTSCRTGRPGWPRCTSSWDGRPTGRSATPRLAVVRDRRYAATATPVRAALPAPADHRRLVGRRRRRRHASRRAPAARPPRIVGPVLREWAVDDDRWLRRTAVIAQVGAKDRTDLGLLAFAAGANLDDRDFFLRKAIGWALRQHARTDPDWVRAFVAGPRRPDQRTVPPGGPQAPGGTCDRGTAVGRRAGRLGDRPRDPGGGPRVALRLPALIFAVGQAATASELQDAGPRRAAPAAAPCSTSGPGPARPASRSCRPVGTCTRWTRSPRCCVRWRRLPGSAGSTSRRTRAPGPTSPTRSRSATSWSARTCSTTCRT